MANRKNKIKPIIILLGEPAAGKATQSKLLVKKYGLKDFDMGKVLRQQEAANINRAAIQKTDYKGKLAPSSIVKKLNADYIEKIGKNVGVIFDGHPKKLVEAKFVARELQKIGRHDVVFLYLSVPFSQTLKRVQGTLRGRADDSVKALRNRVSYFRTDVAATVKFLQARYPSARVSGVGSIQVVHKKLVAALEKLLQSLV